MLTKPFYHNARNPRFYLTLFEAPPLETPPLETPPLEVIIVSVVDKLLLSMGLDETDGEVDDDDETDVSVDITDPV